LVENRPASVTLGRGFWTVTAVLGLLSLIGIYFWTVTPITVVMPIVGAQPGEQVDQLLRFLAASGTALFVFIAGYLIYFSIAFRARAGDGPDAIGVQVHDDNKLEFWWTLIPTLFVILLSILSIRIWAQIQLAQPANGLVVESLGHQWYFTFRYPQINGEVTGEMHLPIGTPVVLNVTSSDVIHSFWVPAFRLKADMIPGLINTIRFTPSVIGRYAIICTEFCGTDHGIMNAEVSGGPDRKVGPNAQYVVVESQAEFQKWYHKTQLANANVSNALPSTTGTISLAGGDPKAGQALFTQKCSACHALGPFSQRIVGPGLKDVLHDPSHPNLVDGDPATPANAAKILQQGFTGPLGVMPNATANGLSDKDIANLVAFLDSMK
jgi:cytochrome c oxidase subunit II